MAHYEGRIRDLKNRVNQHLKKLTGQEIDYFSKMKQGDLVELKTVLADINNVLTLQMTFAAAKWISKYFSIDQTVENKILQKVDNTKPNTKGFDIHITEPYRIIAEVKCISPVNDGGIFGTAQHDSIMNDFHNLFHGKGNLLDTTNYFKFLFLIDLGDRTDQAITKLIKVTKGTTPIANKFNYLKKDKIFILTDDIALDKLDSKKLYLKKIKFN
ncbi:MAG: hypothetical protein JST58_19415 [Bacteroidetes bacterium]|nr:hypothetical protein [Bacteroidota bacterium]